MRAVMRLLLRLSYIFAYASHALCNTYHSHPAYRVLAVHKLYNKAISSTTIGSNYSLLSTPMPKKPQVYLSPIAN